MADTHTLKIGANAYDVVYRKADLKPRKGMVIEVRLATHPADAWFSVKLTKGGANPEGDRA